MVKLVTAVRENQGLDEAGIKPAASAFTLLWRRDVDCGEEEMLLDGFTKTLTTELIHGLNSVDIAVHDHWTCLLYTSPSPRD